MIKKALIIAGVLCFTASSAMAFGGLKKPNIGGSSNSSSKVDVNALKENNLKVSDVFFKVVEFNYEGLALLKEAIGDKEIA